MAYSGIRLSTGCRLKRSEFHQDGDEVIIRLHEKGDMRRTIGIHFHAAHPAAQAIQEYIDKPASPAVPLPAAPEVPSHKLGSRAMTPWTMWCLIESYLEQLPGATKETLRDDGTTGSKCVYNPHSLRATTATLLLDAGVDIIKVKDLLGHRHVTTTQIYDKRRRSTSESASHDLAI